MSQWERVNHLPTGYKDQLHELYDSRDASIAFPMDVRHYLAAWIENQEWQRAAQDHALAMVLFQGLLGELDIQHSRFVQEELQLLHMQHNFRRYKQNFQIYQEEPCKLASTIWWFLGKEKEIIQTADLTGQVQLLHMDQTHMESDSQLERKTAGLRNQVQCLGHTLMCLEEQQDEFDFKYKTHKMEGLVDQAVTNEQQRNLQILIDKLNECRKITLSDLGKLLDSSEELAAVLVNKELAEWQRRQQRVCIGAPENIGLDHLEKWFTCVAECLFQVRKFLNKLDDLVAKLTYRDDPIKVQTPAMQMRVNTILIDLIKSSFVVETQPSMPQGKGPLVLRTNIQFSVKTRLLVKFPELNHVMKVNVTMDREPPQVKGYRRFNVLGTSSKALNMTESQNGGMVADFRHLTLKEQKSGGGKAISEISLSVTEELHLINFDTVFQLHDLEVELKTWSLPVVVISNSSQQQSAWASILWAMMLCQDPKDCLFFANCPVATWAQLRETLSWQFLSATTRALDSSQLDMIAHKLFGKQQNFDDCKVSWSKFSKENCPNLNFTFWMWFDGILVLVKTYLEDLWKDGSIMGFVTKAKEKTLLKKKQGGTFLLRFSESVRDGGITFSWVEYSILGEPCPVKSVQPFTKADLSQIPLHEIIRNYQILVDENVPENPLRYLYPNTPKDEAFGKYYANYKAGDDNPYLKYIQTKLVMVSKGSTLEAKSPMSCGMAAVGEGLDSMNDGLCEEAAVPGVDLHVLEEPLAADPDPMLPILEDPVQELLRQYIDTFSPTDFPYDDDEQGLMNAGLPPLSIEI